MKNLSKLLGSLLLGVGILVMGSRAEATVGVRAPKAGAELSYTTVISSVTPFTVLESTSGITKPGAVYQLILSTGVSGDYLVLFDTNSATGNVLGTGQLADQLGPRYFYSSTSANTVITFDPPLIFFNGLYAVNSAGTESAEIVYEVGRSLTGN